MAERTSKVAKRTRKGADGAAADESSKGRRSTKREAGNTGDDNEPLEGGGVEAEQELQRAESVEGTAEGTGGQVEQLERPERTVREELRSIVREAAIEVLGPVTRKATTAAAKYAVTKGPDLAKNTLGPRVKDTLAPKIEEAGGAGQLAKGALSTVSGAGGGLLSKVGIGGGDGAEARGTGKGRRLPVQESVDVAVPLETAYNQFTQFEDFPQFMHRVEKVEQRDDGHVVWHENIWGIRREWESEITDQVPNERIAWKSLSGTETTGIVTFHRLSDRLTRIEVNLDFQPQGLLEKTASGFRMSRRALKSDLMRFKAFIEMRQQETGAWRGHVEEGEVVEEPEAEEPEEPEAEEPEEIEAEEAGEPEAEEREEPEGEAPVATEPVEEEPEAEAEEEEPVAEAEEEPVAEGEEEPEAEAEEEEEPEAEAEELEPEAEEEPEPEAEEEEEPEEERVPRRRRVRRRAPASPSRRRR
jgi:uncharacterized membrane protein